MNAQHVGNQWVLAFRVGFHPYRAWVLLPEYDLTVGAADLSFVPDAVGVPVALIAGAVNVQVGMGVFVGCSEDLEVPVAADPADPPVAEVDVAHIGTGEVGGPR